MKSADIIQSESAVSVIIGMVLILAIAATLIALLTSPDFTSKLGMVNTPRAAIGVSTSNEGIKIKHMSGDAVPYNDLMIRLNGNNSLNLKADSPDITRKDDGNGYFEPGEEIIIPSSLLSKDSYIANIVYLPTSLVISKSEITWQEEVAGSGGNEGGSSSVWMAEVVIDGNAAENGYEYTAWFGLAAKAYSKLEYVEIRAFSNGTYEVKAPNTKTYFWAYDGGWEGTHWEKNTTEYIDNETYVGYRIVLQTYHCERGGGENVGEGYAIILVLVSKSGREVIVQDKVWAHAWGWVYNKFEDEDYSESKLIVNTSGWYLYNESTLVSSGTGTFSEQYEDRASAHSGVNGRIHHVNSFVNYSCISAKVVQV